MAQAEIPKTSPLVPPNAGGSVSGTPVDFVDGATFFQVPGCAFRPRAFGYPGAPTTMPVFYGGFDGFAWGGFPASWDNGRVIHEKASVPYAALWSWNYDDWGGMHPSDHKRIVPEIMICGRQIIQLGESGDLQLLGEWKPEYWDLLYPFQDAPKGIAEQFRAGKSTERGEDHVKLESNVLRQAMKARVMDVWQRLFQAEKAGGDRIGFTDPLNYPWGCIGLMKLGNKCYAFARHEGKDNLVDLTNGHHFSVEKLFGVGTGYVPKAELREFALTNAVGTADDGILTLQASEGKRSFNIIKVHLDGTREILSSGHPELQLEATYGSTSVVSANLDRGTANGADLINKILRKESKAADADGDRRGKDAVDDFSRIIHLATQRSKRLGTLHSNGEIRWQLFPLTELDPIHVHGLDYYGTKRKYWLVSYEFNEDKPYREISFEYDQGDQQLVTAWDFSSPTNHQKHSGVAYRNWFTHHSPFECNGMERFYSDRGPSVDPDIFDFENGDLLLDDEARDRNLPPIKAESELRDIAYSHRLCYAKFKRKGAPGFRVFDSNRQRWTPAVLGTDEEWNRLFSKGESLWSPVLHTKVGMWVATPTVNPDDRLDYLLVFVAHHETPSGD